MKCPPELRHSVGVFVLRKNEAPSFELLGPLPMALGAHNLTFKSVAMYRHDFNSRSPCIYGSMPVS